MGICRLPQEIVVPNSGPQLGDLEPGSLIGIEENGTQVPFLVLIHGYPAAERTLVIRRDLYHTIAWNSNGVTTYANSALDIWLNTDYLNLLDADIQAQVSTVVIDYTIGGGNDTLSTLTRKVFALSYTELGLTNSHANIEGTAIPYFDSNTKRIAYLNEIANSYWTRSPLTGSIDDRVWTVGQSGIINFNPASSSFSTRPVFTLPATMQPVIWEVS